MSCEKEESNSAPTCSLYNLKDGQEINREDSLIIWVRAEDSDGERVLLGSSAEYNIHVESGSMDFWRNFAPGGVPSDTSRDLYYPDENIPYSNVIIAGSTKMTTGAAIQMAAGYEGRGKGIGVGGATLVYDVNVQRLGKNGSESIIYVDYRHTVGQEGDCMDDI